MDATGKRIVRKWTEREARSALAELARGEVSDVEFARSKGISTQRLSYWRHRLNGGGSKASAFVHVALPASPSAFSQATIEIQFGKLSLRVREEAATDVLVRIVDALNRPQGTC